MKKQIIKTNIKNFLDDIKISSDAKDFWTRIVDKLSPEEIETFIILKKENPRDLVKAIEILTRRKKALSEKDTKTLKEIFEEEKNMFKDII
ncbi:hypothetical protein COT82_01155 [Candidatus Campbellbacteria bacterium CG10_big_fil_rev_8_21_14_0_10_35_52]|uniref:Uncharacterized protein n=1 Tax=Candidatus Campbellbacteria bacterium CG10_big_fil_rev_8_21_14_0_10_35_52 TaxID=1974527 RepID=A0A2M6WVJ3_9BACT|nr:MAG: hypothetical protein COT82_01155 [Candidatus Campbellbacteria bacterium CG10_big_fil_rev_8_21_14_0_10_35_52]